MARRGNVFTAVSLGLHRQFLEDSWPIFTDYFWQKSSESRVAGFPLHGKASSLLALVLEIRQHSWSWLAFLDGPVSVMRRIFRVFLIEYWSMYC